MIVTDVVWPALSYIMQQSRGYTQAVLVAPGVNGIPFQRGAFDGAICIQVPDLVENDGEFFPKIGEILKVHAPLVVSITNRNSYKSVLRRLSGRGESLESISSLAQTRVYRFSVGEVLGRALSAGFRVREIQGYNWIPFPKSSDSRIIYGAAILEHGLMLRRLPCISPWVLVCLEKMTDAGSNCNF